jgi:hypothetical protein
MRRRQGRAEHHARVGGTITSEEYARVYGELRAVVGAHVKASQTFRELWVLWRNTFMAAHGLLLDDEDHRFVIDQLEQAFYAGAATTWELVTRVIPDAVSEADGEKMLSRFNDELDAWSKGGKVS